MATLKAVLAAIDRLNRWVARLVAWLVVAIIAATAYEVVMRYVFNSPTSWVFEFNYLVHGPYFLLLGAYVLAQDGHVNVDIFYGRLSVRGRAVVDLITAPIFFFFLTMMFVYGGKFALNSWGFRETLSSAWGPPIYPIKTIIPVAAGLMILQGLAKFIRNAHLALTGREGEL